MTEYYREKRFDNWKWLFLRARNICLFGLFYYFVTLSYHREEREGTIKETKSLFVRACTNSHRLYNFGSHGVIPYVFLFQLIYRPIELILAVLLTYDFLEPLIFGGLQEQLLELERPNISILSNEE